MRAHKDQSLITQSRLAIERLAGGDCDASHCVVRRSAWPMARGNRRRGESWLEQRDEGINGDVENWT